MLLTAVDVAAEMVDIGLVSRVRKLLKTIVPT
jgi:hypothetical protein